MVTKKKTISTIDSSKQIECEFDENLPIIQESIPKKKRSGAYSKTKGSAYERQIVNELKELTRNENICTARNESKKLDDMKIDISDPDKVLPCYIQTKKTQTTPSVKKINAEVGLTDRPLCILWNIQEKKEGNINITSSGEYAIIPKRFFYELLKIYYAEQNN